MRPIADSTLQNGFSLPVGNTAVIAGVKVETDHVVDVHVVQPVAVVVDFPY